MRTSCLRGGRGLRGKRERQRCASTMIQAHKQSAPPKPFRTNVRVGVLLARQPLLALGERRLDGLRLVLQNTCAIPRQKLAMHALVPQRSWHLGAQCNCSSGAVDDALRPTACNSRRTSLAFASNADLYSSACITNTHGAIKRCHRLHHAPHSLGAKAPTLATSLTLHTRGTPSSKTPRASQPSSKYSSGHGGTGALCVPFAQPWPLQWLVTRPHSRSAKPFQT